MTTPYRNVREALEHRDAELTRRLEELERQREELSRLAGDLATTRRDRDETRASLARLEREPAPTSALDRVQVASPCNARWDTMRGDERVRHCDECHKDVYNLSTMPREEAEAFVAAQTGKVRVRFFKRADGTLLTGDCPVGARRRIGRRVALVVLGGTALATAGAAFAASQTMGEMRPRPATTAVPLPAQAVPPVVPDAGAATPEPEIVMGQMIVDPVALPRSPHRLRHPTR